MSQSTEKFKNSILQEFAKTIELFGLSSIESRVFTILYVEGKPLTLDELSEALGKSKTSMSTSIRSLVELNLVKRVWKKGVRKDLFQANTQLFKHFMSFYLRKWVDATEVRREALNEIKNQMQQLPSDEIEDNLQNKLNELLDFHNKLMTFLFRSFKN